MLIMNTSEKMVTVDENTLLATTAFGTHIPKKYTDDISFLPTSRHNLFSNSSTPKEIIHQTNKTMNFQSVENYIKNLTNPTIDTSHEKVSNMISLCAHKYEVPSRQSLTLFVNRISPNGKLIRKTDAKSINTSSVGQQTQ